MLEIAPECACHGVDSLWHKDARLKAGGSWACAVKHREYSVRWQRAHPAKHRDNSARAYSAQLSRGEQVAAWSHHHAGMSELKSQLGDPRPAGLTLSLVNYNSPDAYWGYVVYPRGRAPYRLSINPDDYVWESQADNNARKSLEH